MEEKTVNESPIESLQRIHRELNAVNDTFTDVTNENNYRVQFIYAKTKELEEIIEVKKKWYQKFLDWIS